MALIFKCNRIALARESRGMTQTKLAEMIGASQQQVAQWEAGKVVPNAENLAKVMTALMSPCGFFFVDSGADGACGVRASD